MEIFLVLLEMSCQSLDLFGKKGDLVLWRTSILIMPLNLTRHLVFLLVRKRHMIVSSPLAHLLQDEPK